MATNSVNRFNRRVRRRKPPTHTERLRHWLQIGWQVLRMVFQGLWWLCIQLRPLCRPRYLAIGALLSVLLGLSIWIRAADPLRTWFPVEHLQVQASFKHVDMQQIVQLVRPYTREGLVRADLQALTQRLERLPWVYQVNTRRVWPNGIWIDIWEQRAVARWGEVGLVNPQGQIFTAPGEAVDLPMLNGPAGSAPEVLKVYSECERLLSEKGLHLAQVVVDYRGSWRATLNQGVELRLGNEAPAQKIETFIRTGLAAVRDQLGQISYIDLRYPNGYAVAKKDSSEAVN
jgi:cell division protein FtsQ